MTAAEGPRASDWDWLPPRQAHLAYTLAHADRHIASVHEVLYDYLGVGPFVLTNRREGELSLVVVTEVRPLPEAVARYFADALTQLRAALEHALFAEVEDVVRQPLSEAEARSLEIPAAETLEAFNKWAAHRHRKRLFASEMGQELLRRVRLLQPFWNPKPSEHPLRLLTDHTNHSKHRAPSLAATQVAMVVPDAQSPDLCVTEGGQTPVEAGAILARGPAALRVELSVWPAVSVQRPDGRWRVLMHELNNLASWVTDTGVPLLVTGASTVRPLPPGIDLTVGYSSIDAALGSAGFMSAFDLGSMRMQAAASRSSLAELLVQHDLSIALRDATAWVSALSDARVVGIVGGLQVGASVQNVPRLLTTLDALAAEVRASREGAPDAVAPDRS